MSGSLLYGMEDLAKIANEADQMARRPTFLLRDSKMATAADCTMLAVHPNLGTWNQSVDRFVALSQFSRE